MRPQTSVPVKLGFTDKAATALCEIDDLAFEAVTRAMTFAEHTLSKYAFGLEDIGALLIGHANVLLILRFDRKRERFIVVAFVVAADDDPDPEPTTVSITRLTLVEDVLAIGVYFATGSATDIGSTIAEFPGRLLVQNHSSRFGGREVVPRSLTIEAPTKGQQVTLCIDDYDRLRLSTLVGFESMSPQSTLGAPAESADRQT